MNQKYVMFLGLILATGTLISLTFGGEWLSGTDVDVASSLTVFKEANIAGIWTIIIPNIDFFFAGMQALTQMDYAFFAGGLELVQWFFLLVFGLGALWGVYTVLIGVITSRFGK